MTSPRTAPPESTPVLVIAGPDRVLELLRLAELRSDDVIVVTPQPAAATRRFVDTFAVELRDRAPTLDDFDGVGAVLLALGDKDIENELVRAARRRRIPIYVADRALVSDFTALDFIAQRSYASLAA